MKLTNLGLNELHLKATDDCGNETRGTRMINIIQRLIAGQYINIVESGDSATISADISADYYDKAKIHELLADLDTVKFKIVSVLPSVGVSNFIYLVEKTAPDLTPRSELTTKRVEASISLARTPSFFHASH